MGELVDMGVKFDFVQKSGAWFSMGETRLGQGRDAAKLYFKNNPEEAEALEARIKASLKEEAQAALKKTTKKDAKEAPAPKKAAQGKGKQGGVEAFVDDFEDIDDIDDLEADGN